MKFFDTVRLVLGDDVTDALVATAKQATQARLESSPIGQALIARSRAPGATLEQVVVTALQDVISNGIRNGGRR